MRLKKPIVCLFTLMIALLLTRVAAYANSSWVWVSETRPYDLFPLVVGGTVLTETLAINGIPKIKKPLQVFIIVLFANLLSFAAAYLLLCLESAIGYSLYPAVDALERGPYYLICVVYFAMTLAAELPVAYFSLRKYAQNKRQLLLTIILSNVLTTVLVAVIERMICYGRW